MDREDIIKLARKAGFDPHDMSDDFTCNLVDIERFAELIVKECCQKLENDGMVEVAMEMKEHFGVKE